MPEHARRTHVERTGSWIRGSDTGSGTVLGIMLMTLVGLGLVLAALLGNLMICRTRARTGADVSALAAASALDEGQAQPCTLASRVARLNRGVLMDCQVDEGDVKVSVGVDTGVPMMPRLVQSARAGPESCG
ncbi:flp pilus-assembly TadE/G-like family protein [Bifidobacterium sp. W8109]|uniref:Rv3654c family TadE-like protein n=1 Tax=Bifidobacterium TaxID=1678 RepID=UPI0018DD24F9|nr:MULTISPECIES: Rv3654c family TadE-like protein [Bifidobacterium]MBH9971220.1 flp pilus-assembly TadE/G-like family protein [Bifidobacterium asteroides]MBH9983820.1 flp pilus-assembly TadE/G-like family protein [Bifidobacterium asteroides]MBI0072457.1 flp pilus-assembly TadE/G-like family protein [Bifidobacterium sp. W8110]